MTMGRTQAMSWVLSACLGYLRLSQVKTLSVLVSAMLGVQRVSLANLGRAMSGDAKHAIKRADRFLGNGRFEVSDGMRGLVGQLLKRKRFNRKPLVVSFDWVQVRSFHTLMAAAVFKGRAAPLVWASFTDKVQGKSQNQLEYGLLTLLRSMVPDKVRVILLADRGFGRTELGRYCQQLGLDYVVRIQPKVWVKARGYEGKLGGYPLKVGQSKLLANVEYRQSRPVVQHVAMRWKRGCDEPWYLMTNLKRDARQVCDLYARRFDIEELFRDAKSKRNGWALRDIQVKSAKRFERLLLILAWAYVILVGLGLWAKAKYPARRWCSNNRKDECSAYTVGRTMLDRLKISPNTAFNALVAAIACITNWG
jgi:hypothetical protein